MIGLSICQVLFASDDEGPPPSNFMLETSIGEPVITIASGTITITLLEPSSYAGTYSVPVSVFDTVDAVNLVPAALIGNAFVGETWDIVPGLWLYEGAAPTPTYNIVRNGVEEEIITLPTYDTGMADAGADVSVLETIKGVSQASNQISVLDMLDDFEVPDRDLAGYVGPSGYAWTEHGQAGASVISNGIVRGGVRYQRGYATRLGTTIFSAFRLTANFRESNSSGDMQTGLMACFTNSDNYYLCRHNRNNTEWRIILVHNGNFSTLGSYADNFSTGTTRTIQFELIGPTLRCLIDGVERISVSDTTHTTGTAGIYTYGGNNANPPTDGLGPEILDFAYEGLS